MHRYRVRFRAVDSQPLADDAAERLERALLEMPGPEEVRVHGWDPKARSVTAEFVIRVRQAMADAARDGSRLAKESLKAAGLPDAQLVDLSVALGEQPHDG
jgi:hypothetical protein